MQTSEISFKKVVLSQLVSAADRKRMGVQIDESIDILIPDHVNRMTVGEWAEQKRILPTGLTPLPGPFRWDVAPYMREIADCFSETSPVQKIAVMKAAQITFTVGALENIIGYIIDCAPGPSMFVSGDKGIAEQSIELRVDRMIESAGLEGKIFSQSEKRHNKKTGDTKAKKEFIGGFLLAIGPNTGAKLRSFSVRYLLCDEVDAYPAEIGTSDKTKGKTASEGDPITLAEKRTDAFESIRKILYGSTPLVEQGSKIKPLFLAGDQRYYYVPCRYCGAMQVLKWKDAEGNYKFKYELDTNGRLLFDLDAHGEAIPGTGHIWYECESCGERWKNVDKTYFLPNGEWRPTATPSEPGFRSYHISALYSPIGMHTWEAIGREWLQTKDDPIKLRTFINTVLGETWVERGEAPRYERVMLRREHYQASTLPETAKPLICTIGADIQKDRIECEVVAWGCDKESWSIEYLTLWGETSDLDSDAWRTLEYVISAPHAGLTAVMTLVDAGYNAPIIYSFCERYLSGVLPIRGSTTSVDERNLFLIRDVPGYQIKRVDLNVDKLKIELYSYLLKGPPEPASGQLYPKGYCHYPIDYDEKYFRMLCAEERMREKMRSGHYRMVWYLQHGRRNEALDARVYALGALYVVYGMRRQEHQDAAGRDKEIEYSWSDFWKEL